MSFWNRHKKKKTEEDLSIVQEYKEPFTWRGFWKKYVIKPIKSIHDYLQKNGILFFLLSPFQYKNRLILKVVLIVIGIMIGIVPRSITMIHQLKERNMSSEIASTSQGSAGQITVDPLMGGFDESTHTHVMAFNIEGDTTSGVPSTTNGFDVSMSGASGVSVDSKMTYRYKVLPVSESSRLLIVAVSGQTNKTSSGVYNLNVHVVDTAKMDNPMNVILSIEQKPSALYQNGSINLSALSVPLTSDVVASASGIKSAQSALDKDINNYKLNEQRLNASGMTIGLTTNKLKSLVNEQIMMPELKDKSTTDILSKLSTKQPPQKSMPSTITYKGKTYKDNGSGSDSDDSDSVSNPARDTELPNLSDMIQTIQSDIGNVNSAKTDKYNALVGVQGVLNKSLKISDMSKPVSF